MRVRAPRVTVTKVNAKPRAYSAAPATDDCAHVHAHGLVRGAELQSSEAHGLINIHAAVMGGKTRGLAHGPSAARALRSPSRVCRTEQEC